MDSARSETNIILWIFFMSKGCLVTSLWHISVGTLVDDD
jgi:hypothetical protein